ncbi:MAG: sugar ABC transporter permease [Firmicutes bacterium]|nr:sugar ABC transporter permease [Bacillota bacterium]
MSAASARRSGRVPTETWMLLPSIVVLAIISLYPFFYMIWMSFMRFSMLPGQPSTFIGFGNWLRMLSDPGVGVSWVVTIKYYIIALALQLTLGVGISLAIERLGRGQGLITTLIIAPMFLAPVLVGLLWRFLLHDSYGIFTYFLRQLGFLRGISVFGDLRTALPAVIIMDTWEWTPLIALITIAGLQALPQDVYEAASIDGATYWQRLVYITFPMLKPVLVVALLIRTMDLVRFYDQIMITTSGGPADATKILAIRIFEQGFRQFNIGYASALGLTLLVVSIILGNFFVKFFSMEDKG